jgi:hypothetical protein
MEGIYWDYLLDAACDGEVVQTGDGKREFGVMRDVADCASQKPYHRWEFAITLTVTPRRR